PATAQGVSGVATGRHLVGLGRLVHVLLLGHMGRQPAWVAAGLVSARDTPGDLCGRYVDFPGQPPDRPGAHRQLAGPATPHRTAPPLDRISVMCRGRAGLPEDDIVDHDTSELVGSAPLTRPSAGEVLHFSEDPTITEFHPHVAATAQQPEA